MSGIPVIMSVLGGPLSPVYSALMRIRAAAYARGLFNRCKLDVPVISVGNLTMGGSGKTPMVMAVARFMQQNGYKPAVISRGYGGKAGGDINLVSDGKDILMPAEDSGDEPLLLAKSLPGVPVITGAKRKLTAPYAVKELGADLIIMDDGFQHLALQRDIDLVLFKAPQLLGDGRVFPGGYLREPISALARAHAFIISGANEKNSEKVEEFSRNLQELFPDRPVFKVGQTLGTPVDVNGREMAVADGENEFYGFCGLADPDSFYNSLRQNGYRISGVRSFPDHHAYTAADLENLAAEAGSKILLTTEKDMVKLKGFAEDIPIYSLPLSVELPVELQSFLQASLTAHS